MKRLARCPAGALVALLLVPGEPLAGEREEELTRLREAIEESRERVTGYEQEQRGLLEAVEALDRSLALLTSEVRAEQRRAANARDDLERIVAEARVLSARLDRTRRSMSARAVALYKAGEVGAVRMLFSAGDLREFLSRVSALRLLLSHDAELILRHREQAGALAVAEERARAASVRRDEAVAALREREGEFAIEREAKGRVIARLHRDRARERAALVELETAARALEETLASLRESPVPSAGAVTGPSFESRKQKLPPPVGAPIVQEFGRVVDEEFLTQTLRNGVAFDAPRGAPVHAVAAARVRYADWFRGYGRLVILDHGGQYFTVSGHLDDVAVAVGDPVDAGAVIGSVGDTGSLAGPRLYFEIRRGGQALDPREWLAPLDRVE